MLSIDFIRLNKQKVIDALRNKNREKYIDNVEKILSLDEERKKLAAQSQKLREERNLISKKTFTEETKTRGRQIKEDLKSIEETLNATEKQLQTLLSFIPNIPFDEVPIGKDATGNVLQHQWGTPKQFKFPIKSHIELGKDLNIIDFERGVKVSGFRGYFLKNEGAVLHLSLLFYVLQKLIKKGYTPLIAPAIVKGFTLFGAGQFPWGQEEVYKLNDEDAYLSGTAEVPVTSYYANEILKEEDLPKKFVAFSPCFRKEAGSYGKDTKGMYRLHEFWKIEQVIIGKSNINEARKIHDELQKNAEEILQDLNLPYQVLLMCTGDMGEPQHKKYDTETWMPSRQGYGETMSNSIMGDFQTRRLNIKYRKKDGTKEYCFSFNNTAVASPRILIALLENYQQEDGTVAIPDVLKSLTGFDVIKKK
ncbi:serine--tRNA ligase [Candidatus Roizmanbacteria bacterium RIFOXYB2_FULL_38_10]|uniref:Serine--tRNA ligase n=1 Tax=Candidatus Roizmanbacteria bacterium RIFOXYD1_FULL_38_12 TaxID=1802093 RepID=A0A1F7KZW6_9BACT|nr:MAG: serine--tRNA ligase [Candidatus Roizmanbacteria bacterium RIFOXYA2_FULL_38_14]OGK63442.1 MAG: serine--tRNA ligase [Candidatus Roizmanbacteria bacterium RIFOXYA1_FULL_37_12]OGK65288.1 MAG: serine--tRNA ligase [Candidatus Roizmanbacteria bacterium RIFOXYB1_FULL_40_23]OGK67998.1 MAG: serine--tRNA ligase [Candidatus Roizmanbacteria bacterium RIFOXYB2_FULL_38_10]OGK69693.1 MAG: serine--tRNA ligase [Candidatus Roizmanbacteria bacterium RIFOXYC1_FULL_38_14]OGK72843.1 MAG: serine--tRNA ligase 